MAPSSGHLLVPKVLNAVRYAIAQTAQAVRTRLPQGQEKVGEALASQAIAVPIRNAARHPFSHINALRNPHVGQTRNFATAVRTVLQETYPSLRSAARYTAPSRTAALAGRPVAATWGSALRPRLTGGALPRTAGGYVGIGGRRAFSHVSSSQAHVLANVSAGVRAFWIGGQRAQFDGVDGRTGEKRFVTIGKHTENTGRKVAAAHNFAGETRGTSLEFCVAPELDAFRATGTEKPSKKSLESQSSSPSTTALSSALSPLATDLARHLGAMAAVYKDLKLLSRLGDLPVSEPRPGWIAVRFPGCDARSVELLCDEVGVSRGIIREDPEWAEEQAQDVKMALLFPTAPSEEAESEDGYGYDRDATAMFYEHHRATEFVMPESLRGDDHHRYGSDAEFTADETLSPLESLHGSWSSSPSHRHSFEAVSCPQSLLSWQPNPWMSGGPGPQDATTNEQRVDRGFQGVSSASREMENIYHFIAECDGRLGMPTSRLL